jgi:hypothetical protein
MGPERGGAGSRRPVAPTADELRAYHEAGHAVAAALAGFVLQRVSIRGRGRHGGSCEYGMERRFRSRGAGRLPERALRSMVRGAASVSLGGSIAQDAIALEHGYVALDRRTGRAFPLFSAGAEDDERSARALARRLYPRAEAQRAFLRRMRGTTERRLTSPAVWRAVRALAQALRRARAMDGARAEQIIASSLHGSRWGTRG